MFAQILVYVILYYIVNYTRILWSIFITFYIFYFIKIRSTMIRNLIYLNLINQYVNVIIYKMGCKYCCKYCTCSKIFNSNNTLKSVNILVSVLKCDLTHNFPKLKFFSQSLIYKHDSVVLFI